jgi:hypothetical protein
VAEPIRTPFLASLRQGGARKAFGRQRCLAELCSVPVPSLPTFVTLMAMTARVPVEGALELAGPGTAEAARAAFLEGMLLALVPSLLPLLVIHLRAPHRRQRQELGMLSLLWPPVVGSFAGMLLWLSLARLAAPALRPGGLATSPEALAVLALPQLLFVLAFWLAPQGLSRLDRTDTRSFLTALMAPILALPWEPTWRAPWPLRVSRCRRSSRAWAPRSSRAGRAATAVGRPLRSLASCPCSG